MSHLSTRQPTPAEVLNNLCHADNPLLMVFPQLALTVANPGLNGDVAGYQAQARGPAIRFPRLLKSLGFPAKPPAAQPTINPVEVGAAGTRDHPPAGQGKVSFGAVVSAVPFDGDGYDALRDFAQKGLSPEALKFENEANRNFTRE